MNILLAWNDLVECAIWNSTIKEIENKTLYSLNQLVQYVQANRNSPVCGQNGRSGHCNIKIIGPQHLDCRKMETEELLRKIYLELYCNHVFVSN